jgi:hypothetical protein
VSYTDYEYEGIDVRRVASEWHGGQFTAHYMFASSGHISSTLASEIESDIRKFEADPDRYATDGADPAEMHAELLALLAYVSQPIVSVWSSYGHRFMSDGDGYASCLTCGGEWELVHDDGADPTHGAYVASNGDAATQCSGDPSQQHGDPRETGHSLDCEDGCAHCRHDCNCVRCSG